MTAVATLGSLKIKFTGGATRASDRASFSRDGNIFAVITTTHQKRSTDATDSFRALSHEHPITDSIIVAHEEDSPIKSFAGPSTGERYRGPRGRLLAFKSTR